MSVSRLDRLDNILRKLRKDSPSLEAAALVSKDGFMVASAFTPNFEDALIAAMAAILQTLGALAAVELTRGAPKEVVIRGDRGYVVLISAGRGIDLLALANETCKLSLALFDMHAAVQAIEKAL